MKYVLAGLLTVCSIFLQLNTVRADDAFARLQIAKSLRCSFPYGMGANSRNGTLKPVPEEGKVEFIVDSIDLQKATARGIGNNGASNLFAQMTLAGLTLVESTSAGNQIFTTVFTHGPAGTGSLFAVYSRHIEIFGTIVASQWYGTCDIIPNQ